MKRYRVIFEDVAGLTPQVEALVTTPGKLKDNKKELVRQSSLLLNTEAGERILYGNYPEYFWLEAEQNTAEKIGRIKGISEVLDAVPIEQIAEKVAQRQKPSNGYINLIIPPRPL